MSKTIIPILIAFINFYQKFISPLLGHNCRFVPSCSCYTRDGIEQQGLRALPKIAARLLRCNPLGSRHIQYDPFNKTEQK